MLENSLATKLSDIFVGKDKLIIHPKSDPSFLQDASEKVKGLLLFEGVDTSYEKKKICHCGHWNIGGDHIEDILNFSIFLKGSNPLATGGKNRSFQGFSMAWGTEK